MSYIDLSAPRPCQFPCSTPDAKTRPLLLPWRQCEGWWSCEACAVSKGQKQMYQIMNKRRIVGTSCLPEWFREWGLFNVRRSNNSITDMVIVDFQCEFSQNMAVGGTTDGRVRLSNGGVYIDFCTEDQTVFKQVSLQNLYESNPSLYDHDKIELAFPPYVDAASAKEWNDAITAAFEAGKKNFTDPPADEVTDDEADEADAPEPVNEGPGPQPAAEPQPEPEPAAEPQPEPEPAAEPQLEPKEKPEPVAEPQLEPEEEPNPSTQPAQPIVADQKPPEDVPSNATATLTQISFWDE